jgi:hypothetical protein
MEVASVGGRSSVRNRLSAVVVAAAVFGYSGRAVADPPPARPDYVFTADPTFGMEGGVRTFGSIGRLLYRYEDALPRVVHVDERKVTGKIVGVLGRSLKWFFLDDPLADVETTAIHEVFGHGARAREFGQKPGVKFALPGVYCSLLTPSDKTCTSFAEGATTSTGLRERDLAVTLGGIESNYVTAWWINAQIMQTDGWVHHGDLLVYWASKNSYRESFFDVSA